MIAAIFPVASCLASTTRPKPPVPSTSTSAYPGTFQVSFIPAGFPSPEPCFAEDIRPRSAGRHHPEVAPGPGQWPVPAIPEPRSRDHPTVAAVAAYAAPVPDSKGVPCPLAHYRS
ncbi:hypothetical protein Amsp01_039340 [Amycolatopsis sp. NBRC 101858]|nr:hypothetical protein Amsp01_039340 [Amycolatopsis sp. NBRC 101858]